MEGASIPWALGGVVLAGLLCASASFAAQKEAASLESAGLSGPRLGRMDGFLEGEISAQRKAGAVVLIARYGKVAYLKAYGSADLASRAPLRTDAYFRLFSMTKPVTAVALLTLYEQGKFQLGDPLSKYLPAFAHLKVFAGEGADGELLEDAKWPITMEDVFRHTAGFAYGFFGTKSPVDALYLASGLDYPKLKSLKELVDKLATLPLLRQPGTRWNYSVAADVQAYLVESFSGMAFDAYCRKAIFEPLGMRDTVFGIPEDRASRFPTVYGPGPLGVLRPSNDAENAAYARMTAHPFGGVSLSSTAMDYFRFAQMLLNGGELAGVRILGKKTVELMAADHLQPGIPPLGPGTGFGLGVGVVTDAVRAENLGSKGELFWSGYATTQFLIDPKEQLVALLLTQYIPMDEVFLNTWTTLVYQSLVH